MIASDIRAHLFDTSASQDYSFKSAVCESGGVAAALKKRYQSKADLVEEMMTGLNAYVDLLLTGDDADVEDDFLQKHLVHPFHGEKRRKCEHTIGSPKNLVRAFRVPFL